MKLPEEPVRYSEQILIDMPVQEAEDFIEQQEVYYTKYKQIIRIRVIEVIHNGVPFSHDGCQQRVNVSIDDTSGNIKEILFMG